MGLNTDELSPRLSLNPPGATKIPAGIGLRPILGPHLSLLALFTGSCLCGFGTGSVSNPERSLF